MITAIPTRNNGVLRASSVLIINNVVLVQPVIIGVVVAGPA
jgi:hypothetical protein